MVTSARPRPAGLPATRPSPPSLFRRSLRLARTEFTLIYRYRTALFLMVFPIMFTAVGMVQQGGKGPSGLDAGAMAVTGGIVIAPVFVGLAHVSNVYTARRELLVLKRFRVSGVPRAALFGGTLLSVLGVIAVLTLLSAAVLAFRFDLLPANAALVLLSVLLVTVVMVFLGIALTRFTRSAEGAQLISMVPFVVLYALSGQVVPLDVLPGPVSLVARILPMAPATMAVRSGYFGRDLFAASGGAAPAGALELWAAAVPSLAVLAAWVAVSAYLLRFVRWDPRQAS